MFGWGGILLLLAGMANVINVGVDGMGAWGSWGHPNDFESVGLDLLGPVSC